MDLKKLSDEIRKSVIDMAYASGKNGSHIGPALSTVEIFAALYGKVLKYDVKNPKSEERDRLIISKGHCVLAYYSALYYAGFLTKEDLDSFETNGSHFHGHAMRNLENGIEFSGGSLSMGMSFAVGVAIACKKKKLNNHVYVLVGDGECDEGLIWEAAMSASHYNLNNLTVIVDKNKLQYDGRTTEVMNHDELSEKFKAFGFDIIKIDGHNPFEIAEALKTSSKRPMCVIADTIKGKGISFMEGIKTWHHSVLNDEQYKLAKEELAHV